MRGPIAGSAAIWADGKLIDLSRLHPALLSAAAKTQTPDPLIVAKEGADNAPAYRGLAYVVFEDMPLADFGNRMPQLSFEVFRRCRRQRRRARDRLAA